MKHYKVIVADEAVDDLESIYHYIAEVLFAPDAAEHVYNSLIEAMGSLKEMPDRIRIMDLKTKSGQVLRKVNVGKYAIIFTIRKETVSIINIFYGASDIDNKLDNKGDE